MLTNNNDGFQVPLVKCEFRVTDKDKGGEEREKVVNLCCDL